MNTNLSLKNWPNITEFDNLLHDALTNLSLPDLETTYTETSDGKDTWTIRDPKSKTDIICIIIDGDLKLHIEPLENHPTIDWFIEQLSVAYDNNEQITTKEPTQPMAYIGWSIMHRAVGPTIQMAQTRLKTEKERCPYPSLLPIYKTPAEPQ